MKRLSSKKRKLNYIREKNHYRLGYFGCSFLKVTKEIFEDSEFLKTFVESDFELNLKKISDKFKMNFEIYRVESGQENNDFMHDLFTIKYYYKKINN